MIEIETLILVAQYLVLTLIILGLVFAIGLTLASMVGAWLQFIQPNIKSNRLDNQLIK